MKNISKDILFERNRLNYVKKLTVNFEASGKAC